MRLGSILPECSPADSGVEVTSLAFDDREVMPGTMFFCVPGFQRDGHNFAPMAVAAGAAALVVERPLGLGVPEILVPSVRAAMGPAASRFNRDPSSSVKVAGVTGTNGKTTSAYLIRSLLEASGMACGLLGTVESIVAGRPLDAVRTTPEAIELQALLAQMRDGGDKAAAIEVSSHALDLGRADGTTFAASVFTNLTQDHLDYHGSMEAYWQAKRRLFVELPCGVPVVNIDDPYGRSLADELGGAVTIGLGSGADWSADGLTTGLLGSAFRVTSPCGQASIETRLPGEFNVRNVLGAMAAAVALGVSFDDVVAAVPAAARVPGRFEPVDRGQPFAVLVDYAHTPDSLENVIAAARHITERRVICLVGCGGDRDRTKRPLMGEIAARDSDLAVITSDNPRSEDPEAIVSEVAAGADLANRPYETVIDRRAAIERTIEVAEPGDVVLIAGKGHEQGQEFEEGRKIPFDDRVVAAEALGNRGWQ